MFVMFSQLLTKIKKLLIDTLRLWMISPASKTLVEVTSCHLFQILTPHSILYLSSYAAFEISTSQSVSRFFALSLTLEPYVWKFLYFQLEIDICLWNGTDYFDNLFVRLLLHWTKNINQTCRRTIIFAIKNGYNIQYHINGVVYA